MPCDRRFAAEGAGNHLRTLGLSRHRPLRRSRAAVRRVRESVSRQRALLRVRPHAGRPADARARRVEERRADAGRCARTRHPGDARSGRHSRGRDRRQGRGLPRDSRDARRASPRRARSNSSCSCSCRCSTWMGTSASAATTARTRTARKRWAGARPRRTTTSIATTRRPMRRRCRRCCASSTRGIRFSTWTCTSPTARSSKSTSRTTSSRCSPAMPACSPAAARSSRS